MTSLELILLGGFQARAAGHAIDVSGRKERALLAVLAMPPGEPRSRDKLAGLLWSDRGDKHARDSLKQAILRLRKSFDVLHPLPILTDRESLTLDAAKVAVDVQEFEHRLDEGTPEAVARAATLYRGDLLDGLDVRDPVFEEWLLFERQRLRDLARGALTRLLDLHMTSGAHDQAGVAARRLLALDPLQEAAHRALMRIYAEHGQTAQALKQYQICRDALQGELGVKPDAETERLYQVIREKRTTAKATHTQAPPAETAAETRSLFDAPPLQHDPEETTASARPSIAVLPFENRSDDPAQQYFSDGITEDIITALSRVKWLFVIARNSSFTYQGRSVDVTQVARELGVRYVLEGSVRKAGGRVRITGQLIRAETAQHMWADKFDGELADVFDLQDQMTASVVAAVEPTLRQAEIDRARRKPTERLDAYDCYLRALPHFYTLTRAGIDEALVLLDRAAAIDPYFALAKALAARGYAWRNPQGWAAAPKEEKTIAVRLGREALQEGADDPTVLWMVGFMMWQLRVDPEGALELYDKSLAINPNSAQALTLRGWALATAGRGDEAIASLRQADRLSPLDPEAFITMSAMGSAYSMAGRFDEAIKWTTRALRERPTFAPALRFHAVCLAELGRSGEARDAVAQLLHLEPGLTISTLRQRVPIFDAKLMNAFLGGLRKAGLPE